MSGDCKLLHKKRVTHILGKVYHIPKTLRPIVLKELVSFNIAEKHDKYTLKILPPKMDPVEDQSILYKKFNFW